MGASRPPQLLGEALEAAEVLEALLDRPSQVGAQERPVHALLVGLDDGIGLAGCGLDTGSAGELAHGPNVARRPGLEELPPLVAVESTTEGEEVIPAA